MTSVPWGIHWDGDIYHLVFTSWFVYYLHIGMEPAKKGPFSRTDGPGGIVFSPDQLVAGFFAAETLFFNSRQLQGLLVVLALMVGGRRSRLPIRIIWAL